MSKLLLKLINLLPKELKDQILAWMMKREANKIFKNLVK